MAEAGRTKLITYPWQENKYWLISCWVTEKKKILEINSASLNSPVIRCSNRLSFHMSLKLSELRLNKYCDADLQAFSEYASTMFLPLCKCSELGHSGTPWPCSLNIRLTWEASELYNLGVLELYGWVEVSGLPHLDCSQNGKFSDSISSQSYK